MAGLSHRARVIGRAPLSPRVTELVLAIEGDEPFRWLAGQHVTLRPDLPNGEASAFSIAAAPNQAGLRELTLAVSNRAELLAHAERGSVITLDGPFGSLIWRDAPGALLVGVGTGIAPLRAIAHGALAEDGESPLVLVAGNRTRADLLWHEELAALASEHARFRYEPVVSQPDDRWNGRGGHVQDHLGELVATLPDGFRAYLCGSARMVADCRRVLGELGLPDARVTSEADA